MYTIGQVSELFDLPKSTIRYYSTAVDVLEQLREQAPIVEDILKLIPPTMPSEMNPAKGMMKKISIRPIIFADEPTASLDQKNKGIVLQALQELNAKGATVLVVTHYPTLAAEFDHVLDMNEWKKSIQ